MLQVGLMEQSECTASFTLRNENLDNQVGQQRNPKGSPGGNPGGSPEGTPMRSIRKRRVYDLVNTSLLGGRFVGSPVGGDHGSPSSTAGVAFVLAVAQLLAVATFEFGVTSRSGARGWSRA